jgi:hypothetical protein
MILTPRFELGHVGTLINLPKPCHCEQVNIFVLTPYSESCRSRKTFSSISTSLNLRFPHTCP